MGIFTSNPDSITLDPPNYVVKLKELMRHLRVTLPRHQQNWHNYVSDNLQTCTHAFVRRDTVKPLQAPYDGPYEILHCIPQHFSLKIKGQKDVVLIDRMKPVFLDLSPSSNCLLFPTPVQF